jgi:hypothetical protein
MRKSLILSTFLLLCAVWVSAQTSGSSGSATQPSSPSSTATSQSSSSDSSQTVQGCLSGSAGNFTLTSSSGTIYQLAGDTSKLSDHVGEQVEITGSAASGSDSSGSTATSPSGSGSSMGGSQTINVQKVKKIASSCSTSR